jgi:hypothetical protein
MAASLDHLSLPPIEFAPTIANMTPRRIAITADDGVSPLDLGGPPEAFRMAFAFAGPRIRRIGVAQCVAHAMIKPSLARAFLLAFTSSLVTGCSFGIAPSFELFGAYFPAWMLCAVIGIIGAFGARAVLTTSALSGVVPFQFAVCTAIGVVLGLLSWVALFG